MYTSKVKLCGVNTEKLPVLTEKQNKQYIQRLFHDGDMEARQALISGNLRLVLSVVARFNNRGENLDDLFQVGCIGLIKAIDHFDPKFDVRFSTYAVPMIIGEIRRFLRDNTPLRVSRSLRDLAYRAMREKEEFMARYNREPTNDELARALEVSPLLLTSALDATYEPMSLNEPVYSEGGDTLYVGDQLGDGETDSDWLCEISFKSTLKQLPDREKSILYLRFMMGKTQTEVAKEVGISQAQVSRLEKCALEKIKSQL